MSMKTYLVGGFVRDSILNIKPTDRDFVVIGETPKTMLSKGFKQVGADFPVFLHPWTNDEYALARTEKSTGNGYNDFSTEWENVSLLEDLRRRDFTMNSIAIDNEDNTIIDPFFGTSDIYDKIIRHTSEAFIEDPLRILRCLRFKSNLGHSWTIHSSTWDLMIKMANLKLLESIPGERILLEIMKVKDLNLFIELSESLNILDQILPGINIDSIKNNRNSVDFFISSTRFVDKSRIDILYDRLKPPSISKDVSYWLNEWWNSMTNIDMSDIRTTYQMFTSSGMFNKQSNLFPILNKYTNNKLLEWKLKIGEYPKTFIKLYTGKDLGDKIMMFRMLRIKDIINEL